jgi:hypothetical protein
MILHKTEHKDVVPSLYYVSQMINNKYSKYSPLIVNKPPKDSVETAGPVECYSSIAEAFEQEFNTILEELFNPDIPFTQVEDKSKCKECDYKKICRQLKEQEY